MEKVKILLDNATTKEYHELATILKRHKINVQIVEEVGTGDELGFGFEELIILLPLAISVLSEIRKAFQAYLDYKKPL